ncbi:MAG: hypothetical protein U1E67_12260 [Hyphomicrobiales bacterium]
MHRVRIDPNAADAIDNYLLARDDPNIEPSLWRDNEVFRLNLLRLLIEQYVTNAQPGDTIYRLQNLSRQMPMCTLPKAP